MKLIINSINFYFIDASGYSDRQRTLIPQRTSVDYTLYGQNFSTIHGSMQFDGELSTSTIAEIKQMVKSILVEDMHNFQEDE